MGWQDRAYNQENNGGIPPVQFRLPKLTPLVASLIVVNLALFLLKVLPGASLYVLTIEWGALELTGNHWLTQPWRWVTYQYLHANGMHVFFNLIALFFFLPTLEGIWGWKKAWGFYTLGGIAGGILYVIMASVWGQQIGVIIGASGSVLAALGAVALLFPSRVIVLLFFPVPIRMAAALIGALFVLKAVADRDLSDACHLGGLAFGFFAPWFGGPIVAKYRQKYRRMKIQREAEYEAREQEQIDRILEKVSHHGMQSLTNHEKKVLQRATERQRRQEAARARRAY